MGSLSPVLGTGSLRQLQDAALQERLKEALQSEDENLLLGIADNYGSLEKYTAQAKREIRAYLTPMVRQEHLSLLSPQKTYYDAYVTRPYIIYQDSKTEAPGRRFQNLKRIWDGRRCILVEGKMTGLGVGNDLFGNAGSGLVRNGKIIVFHIFLEPLLHSHDVIEV